jgi:hypothetical protein
MLDADQSPLSALHADVSEVGNCCPAVCEECASAYHAFKRAKHTKQLAGSNWNKRSLVFTEKNNTRPEPEETPFGSTSATAPRKLPAVPYRMTSLPCWVQLVLQHRSHFKNRRLNEFPGPPILDYEAQLAYLLTVHGPCCRVQPGYNLTRVAYEITLRRPSRAR